MRILMLCGLKLGDPGTSQPPCRIGKAEPSALALCDTLSARLPPPGPTASLPTWLKASCRWRICQVAASDPEPSEALPQSLFATVVRSASPVRDHPRPALLYTGLRKYRPAAFLHRRMPPLPA